MQSITITDLPHTEQLDRSAMAAVAGGRAFPTELAGIANVNVSVEQNIIQFQDIEVNALNNVGIIGAGFGPLALNVSPKQFAATRAVF